MITIGVCGPIDLKLLQWDMPKDSLPLTNAFPLTSYFINALLKRGYKVIGYTNSRQVSEPTVIESGNLKICISREKPQPGRRLFKFEIEELKEMINQHPAQVISAFWTYEYALAALDSKIPTVVSIHDVALQILLKQFDPFRFVRWLLNLKVLRKANTLIANSSYTFSQLSSGTKARTVVIPNFYPEEFEPVKEHLPEKENYIVASSNGFTKRKNIHRALEAFQKVRKVYPDLELHLIGTDMQQNGLANQYAAKKGLTEGVRFLGQQNYSRVKEIVSKAKVLICPSMEESFGMAILEAMVIGTAVVAGEKSGFVPTLLNHGSAGVLCNIYSADSIAQGIISLLQDDAYRVNIAQTAQSFARNYFSEEVVINQHLALLHRLIPPSAATFHEQALHPDSIRTTLRESA